MPVVVSFPLDLALKKRQKEILHKAMTAYSEGNTILYAAYWNQAEELELRIRAFQKTKTEIVQDAIKEASE